MNEIRLIIRLLQFLTIFDTLFIVCNYVVCKEMIEFEFIEIADRSTFFFIIINMILSFLCLEFNLISNFEILKHKYCRFIVFVVT